MLHPCFFGGFLQMNFDEVLLPRCLSFAFACGSIVFADNWTRSNRKWRPGSCCCQTSEEHFVVNLHHFNLVVSPSALENVSAIVTTRQRRVNYRVSAAAVWSVNCQCFVAALCCKEKPTIDCDCSSASNFTVSIWIFVWLIMMFVSHLYYVIVIIGPFVLQYWFGNIPVIQLSPASDLC